MLLLEQVVLLPKMFRPMKYGLEILQGLLKKEIK
mgnify:CR=1 FL=1